MDSSKTEQKLYILELSQPIESRSQNRVCTCIFALWAHKSLSHSWSYQTFWKYRLPVWLIHSENPNCKRNSPLTFWVFGLNKYKSNLKQCMWVSLSKENRSDNQSIWAMARVKSFFDFHPIGQLQFRGARPHKETYYEWEDRLVMSVMGSNLKTGSTRPLHRSVRFIVFILLVDYLRPLTKLKHFSYSKGK